ncbi:MAG: phage tail tube protein [Azonexus sp.]
MALATGIAKQLRYKVEATYGVAPGVASAQLLRRTQSTVDLSKDTYQSNEIRTDYQIADFRHGVRKVGGNINGELSPGTYKDFIAAAMRKAFVAGAAATGLSITIAAGTAPFYTLTRAAGSWLTDGIKLGDVGRFTAGTFNVANTNTNVFIAAMTATVLTVQTLNGAALVAEGPIASATFTVTGKKTYAAPTGQLDQSFSIEHWYSDITQSELFTGCKINTVDINLPPSGMATVGFGVVGKDLTTGVAQYFTSPSPLTASGVVAAVNGVLQVAGGATGICTGLSLKIDGGYSGDPVVGANTIPAQFPGRIRVSGQLTAYFQDAAVRDLFVNEVEATLAVALTTNNTASADFIAFVLPRIKVGGATKSDSEKGLVITLPFTALIQTAGGTGTAWDNTTLSIQDSLA